MQPASHLNFLNFLENSALFDLKNQLNILLIELLK